jgi:hypothetical protein
MRRRCTGNGLEARADSGVHGNKAESQVDNLRIAFVFHGSYIL